MEINGAFAGETAARRVHGRATDNEEVGAGIPACSVPDRLRWTSDFLDLADKAIAMIACVQGLEYPSDLHRTAQRDLRAWAGYLEDHPSVAAELDMASVVTELSGR